MLEGLNTLCIKEIMAQLILYSVQNQGHILSCLIGGEVAKILFKQVRLYLCLSDNALEECVHLSVRQRVCVAVPGSLIMPERILE